MNNKFSFPSCLTIVCICFFLAGCSSGNKTQSNKVEEIEVTKIWDKGPHNAFTDLIRFKNNFYCTFREATEHVKGWDGKARILKSSDGKNWESIALLEMPGQDVRDPKLSITPDNRLMVLMDVENVENAKVILRKPFVSFSDKNGENFSSPKASTVDAKVASWSDWVWRVTWYKNEGYSVCYQPNGNLYLYKTKDGSHFENVSKINIDGLPNESTIRFDKNGKMYVVIRREQKDKMGVIATSNPPYKDWTFNYMNQRLGGPDFIFLNDSTLCIGSRLYPKDEIKGEGNKRHLSAVFIADLKGNVRKVIELPSGGDTSYPGMVVYDGKLWYSYYSSHEGKSAIYLAEIPLSKLN